MITRPEIMEGIRRHIQPIGGQENLNILEVEPGHVRLSIELTEACLNLYGNAHGGFLFSLCDIAAGMSPTPAKSPTSPNAPELTLCAA